MVSWVPERPRLSLELRGLGEGQHRAARVDQEGGRGRGGVWRGRGWSEGCGGAAWADPAGGQRGRGGEGGFGPAAGLYLRVAADGAIRGEAKFIVGG